MVRLSLLNGQSPAPSPGGDGQSIAKSLSISFVSVFCITIAYISLNFIGRCIRRRRRGQLIASDHSAAVKVDNECIEQLEAIPVLLYTKPPMACEADVVPEPDICSICLAEYEDGEGFRMLPECNHMFHRECIDRWLLNRSSFCPKCRNRVIRRARELVTANCRQDGDESENQVVVTSNTRSSTHAVATIL